MGRHSASILPLHQAVALRPPVEMIQTLVITYPAGIKAKETSFGRLPLHVACRSGASPEAIECLLAYHPDGSMEGDTLRRIPLHYALKNDAGAEVVALLLDAYPEGVSCADHRGWIPLHVACSMGTDLDVIELLLEEYPETVLLETHKGSDCVKCARMSKGHPNEDAIVKFMEERMAEQQKQQQQTGGAEGGENGAEEEKTETGGGGSDDDESHHEDDDDLIDFGHVGNDQEEKQGGDGGEMDLLGLTSDGSGTGDAGSSSADAKNEDLLLDLDTTTDVSPVEHNEAAGSALNGIDEGVPPPMPSDPPPPMPSETPAPPPPPPVSITAATEHRQKHPRQL